MRIHSTNSFCQLFLVLCVLFSLGTPEVHSQFSRATRDVTRPVTGLERNIPQTFVLICGKVVTAPGEVLEKQSLLIRNGVIEQIADEIALPVGGREIDLAEQTVYAGFVDAYSQSEIPMVEKGALHWNSKVQAQRIAADHLDQAKDSENSKLRKQGFVARLVAPNDGILKGASCLVTTGGDRFDQALLRRKVAQHITLTSRRSGGRREYPSSPMGAVALVRQAMLDANWYSAAWSAFQSNEGLDRPDANDALAAISEHIGSRSLWIVDAADERYFMRADRLSKEFDLSIAVRGSGREYRRLKEIAATGHPVLLPINFPKAPNVSTAEAARSATLERLMHWDLAPENPAKLADAGVKFALTTDRQSDVSKFLKSLRTAVKRGLRPEVALASITTHPAEILGVSDQLGTIAAGRAANLVVLSGDLFDDKSKVTETWVDGQRYEFEVDDSADIRGTWEVTLNAADGPQVAGELKISGSRKKPKAEMTVSDEKVKVKNLSWRDYKLSFAFDAESLSQKGLARVTFVATSDDFESEAMLGVGTMPGGSPLAATARLAEPAGDDESEETDDESDGDDEKEDAEQDEADAEDQDETEDAETADKEDADKEDGSDEEEGSDKESDDKAGEDEGAKDKNESKKASFAVNYPLGAYGRESIPEQPPAVLFTNATVWTCGPEGIIENGSVLIESGKITSVGKEIAAPAECMTIDCEGKHISPGIIDCHSHIATDGGVNEGTQAITAEVRIADFVDADDIAIYRQLAGGVTAANVLHGSANPIGGQNQVIKMRWGVEPEDLKFSEAPQGVKFALGENVKQSNWSNPTSRYPQTRMGVDEIINDAFRRAKTYAAEKKEWQDSGKGIPHRTDLELEALSEILTGTRWIHCHSYRQSEILALLKTCDKYDVTIGTLQHILEGYKVADEMAKRGVMGSSFADWWAYKFEVYDAIPHNGALMHDAGVVVSFNSDDAELGRRLNLEAAKAVRFGGVSRQEALKFVTANPARQLRIDDYVGSLQKGKHADLVVWSADPLSSYARCEQTWVDGRKYFDLDDDRSLRERDAERHAYLIQKITGTEAEQLKPGEKDDSLLELWPRHDIYCHGHGHDHEHH